MIQKQLLKPADLITIWTPWDWHHLGLSAIGKVIEFYEGRLFPKSPKPRPHHQVRYLGDDCILDITAPKPKILRWDEFVSEYCLEKNVLRVWRYNRFDTAGSPEVIASMRETARAMEGHNFGYEDFMLFVFETLIEWVPGAYKLVLNLLGENWKNLLFKIAQITPGTFVCSSGQAAVDLKAHKDVPDYPRPYLIHGGIDNLYIERVTPSHCEAWGEHNLVWQSK